MSLFEIVGCVPTGNFFVITMLFLQDEKKNSFEWALHCLKGLIDPNHLPEVIVTDRELALIHTIESVFPSTYHILCTRHIAKNMEAIARSVTKSVVFALGFLGNWNRIVHAETKVSYEENVQHFQKIYAGHQELLKYVQTTWLIHARKFVHAYTNKVLHFGNRTTNKVESAHNSLKRFLKTSTGNLDSLVEDAFTVRTSRK
ncbi:hypothetical protein POM88_002362 [Heracleum sosnowskyi]|uniref:MULE transposase domain-containing protein n=1 Tax=Heracleum sosnowskyi TaxID=360622 RepID=A0AAD8JE85_9APIA|nr:hypothetical protein POM88_002362 [Heracleum sosnowskyi]